MLLERFRAKEVTELVGPTILLTALGKNPRTARYALADDPTRRIVEAQLAAGALVQLREQVCGSAYPDQVIALCTEEAYEGTFPVLLKELKLLPTKTEPLRIPLGVNGEELQEIMTALLRTIPEKCTLTLDLTHGFRSYPFLFFTAVAYLKALRPDVAIDGIYYGMLDARVDDVAPFVDLSILLRIMEWVYAVRVFRDTKTAHLLANLLEPLTKPQPGLEKTGSIKCIRRDIEQFSEFFNLACPLELGITANSLSRRLTAGLPEALSNKVPLGNDLMEIIRRFAESTAVPYSKKRCCLLNQQELERQADLIDTYFEIGAYSSALGLVREWMVSAVVLHNGNSQSWLERSERREAENRLNNQAAQRLHAATAPVHPYCATELITYWKMIGDQRNGLAHHGFRPQNVDLVTVGNAVKTWNEIKSHMDDRSFWLLPAAEQNGNTYESEDEM